MKTKHLYHSSFASDIEHKLRDEDDFINELYQSLRHYLQITRRVTVLSRRMGLLNKMIAFFKNEFNQTSGVWLGCGCCCVCVCARASISCSNSKMSRNGLLSNMIALSNRVCNYCGPPLARGHHASGLKELHC